MGVINRDEVVGIKDEDGKIKCSECMTNEDWDDMKEDMTISEDDTQGDDIYYCDYCKKRL